MKKIITVVLVLMCWTMSAQDLIAFGIKAGMAYNAENGLIKTIGTSVADLESNEDRGDGSVGFQGGILMRAKLIGFFVQPELLYTGYKTEYETNGENFDIKKQRLDLPVTFGFSFLNIVHTQAGPVFSYYFEDKITLDDIRNSEQDNFNVGFQLGLGVKLGRFLIDARYEFGFGKIVSSFISNSTEYQTENRSQLLHFSLSYLF